MNDVNNLKDVLKASPRSNTYANALQSLEPLYKGGSQARGYSPLMEKLKEDTQQNFCIACAIAGQQCSKHLKGAEPPVMSVDDLLGDVSPYALALPQFEGKNNAGQQNNGVYLMINLSNPQSYAVAGAMLKAAAQYYATQNGKDSSYSKNADGKAYCKSTYANASQGSGGKK